MMFMTLRPPLAPRAFPAVLCALLVCTSSSLRVQAQSVDYPDTTKVDQIDEYFGVRVPDPYRWLEQDVRNAEGVRDWVSTQNEVSFSYLEQLPGRDDLRQRLTALWNYEKQSAPYEVGGRWFHFRNGGLQDHYVMYEGASAEGPWRVLFDPNAWSEDGTRALGEVVVSDDGRYAAYAVQESGSDWRTWRVRDITAGEDLADELRYLKFTTVSWEKHGQGFFYSKYPDPQEGAAFTGLNLQNKVMYHRLGTPQADDVVVYWRPENPGWNYSAQVTGDGRYLLIAISVGTDDRSRVYVKDLEQRHAAPVPLIDNFDNSYRYIENDGPVLYFKTNYKAPRGRVVAIDLRQPAVEHWRELVPESQAVLETVGMVNNLLVCRYLSDVKSEVMLYTLQGRAVRAVELPGIGTAAGFNGERGDTQTFYTFSSFATPPSIYRYDLLTGETSLHFRPDLDIDPEHYETRQVFYASKDGTKIPMFVTHRKGIDLDGTNPTILYGYGGFNVSLKPRFRVSRLAWLEMGGVYAVANLRGGGEYGREWHDAGKKMNKQKVFDDFIAAAEHLIDAGYTSRERLAIKGGSNGGLLVGAAMTQRPDLFAVALPAVGVMDMLRFDAFTAGRYWTDDYGSSNESKEMFRYLLGYSPYHNLKDGTAYPATLVTTADTDDRVVPGHSFKFAARLQEAHEGDKPVLIRIETRAGHGSGKPTWMVIEELADEYAFTARHLGVALESSQESGL
ncbi:MAG: prolyl oligopeptidase family serine peptidase [Pseudomonadota bacterium]